MTVFNAFLKVIRKNIVMIIIYTAIVIGFAALTMQTDNSNGRFVSEKPSIVVINNDSSSKVSDNFEKYLKENCEIVEISGEEAIADALFYREICCVVTIPKNFGKDVLDGKSPSPVIKSTGESYAAFTGILISRYLCIQNVYADNILDENELIKAVNKAVEEKAEVEMATALDTSALTKASIYFDFVPYSLMSCILFIICLVLSSFNNLMIRKRTIVSSKNYKRYNFDIFMSCLTYVLVVWFFFSVLGYLMIGDILLTVRGAMYILNMFVFSVATLALAYFLSTFLLPKNAISGIVNVIALGSSFLCGVFVPAEFLGEWVKGISHIFPTYWYIQNSEIITTAENLGGSIMSLGVNTLVMFGFAVIFVLGGIFVSAKKRKIA